MEKEKNRDALEKISAQFKCLSRAGSNQTLHLHIVRTSTPVMGTKNTTHCTIQEHMSATLLGITLDICFFLYQMRSRSFTLYLKSLLIFLRGS